MDCRIAVHAKDKLNMLSMKKKIYHLLLEHAMSDSDYWLDIFTSSCIKLSNAIYYRHVHKMPRLGNKEILWRLRNNVDIAPHDLFDLKSCNEADAKMLVRCKKAQAKE